MNTQQHGGKEKEVQQEMAQARVETEELKKQLEEQQRLNQQQQAKLEETTKALEKVVWKSPVKRGMTHTPLSTPPKKVANAGREETRDFQTQPLFQDSGPTVQTEVMERRVVFPTHLEVIPREQTWRREKPQEQKETRED